MIIIFFFVSCYEIIKILNVFGYLGIYWYVFLILVYV